MYRAKSWAKPVGNSMKQPKLDENHPLDMIYYSYEPDFGPWIPLKLIQMRDLTEKMASRALYLHDVRVVSSSYGREQPSATPLATSSIATETTSGVSTAGASIRICTASSAFPPGGKGSGRC